MSILRPKFVEFKNFFVMVMMIVITKKFAINVLTFYALKSAK